MTIATTYSDVEQYYADRKDEWEALAVAVETLFVKARDRETSKVPIYLTKMRIKKPASAYLKTKRKGKKSLSEITDWIGLRILCLFEQDIYPTHRFLAELFSVRTPSLEIPYLFRLYEITTFNWVLEDVQSKLEDPLRGIFSESDVRFRFSDKLEDCKRDIVLELDRKTHKLVFGRVNKGSGYKSIHYLVGAKRNDSNGEEVKFEIQLRTLLQDVWGELEHALSYKKGTIHPHIKNSFQLLADELQAKDVLVSQLRDIHDREISFTKYAVIKSGPMRWLGYDNVFLDEVFGSVPELEKSKSEYLNLFSGKRHEKGQRTAAWCDEVSAKLVEIERLMPAPELRQYPNETAYFLDMENAFVYFSKGHLDKALCLYEKVRTIDEQQFAGRNRWVVYFRLGELYFAHGYIENALVEFDRCQSVLNNSRQADDRLDVFYVKIKLATVYWALGSEYIEMASDLTNQAKTEFDHVNDSDLQGSLLNNIAYFALEKYIKELSSSSAMEIQFNAEKDAEYGFKNLKEFIEENPGAATSNSYDTLAWYCFNAYKKHSSGNQQGVAEDARKYLDDAIMYLEMAEGKVNRAGSFLISSGLQREHFQVILTEANREGLGIANRPITPLTANTGCSR